MPATTNSLRRALLVASAGFLAACDQGQPDVDRAAERISEERRLDMERLEKSNAAMEAEAAELQRRLGDLQRKIDEAGRDEPAGAPAPPPSAPTVPAMRPDTAPSIHGVVQAASNQQDVFVISSGSKDGVAVGMECHVTRNGEPVTTLVIEKVFPNFASGSTKPGVEKRDVQPGDEAQFVALGFSLPK